MPIQFTSAEHFFPSSACYPLVLVLGSGELHWVSQFQPLGSSQSTGSIWHTQKPFPRGVGSAVTKGVLAGWSGALPTVVGGVGVGGRQESPPPFLRFFWCGPFLKSLLNLLQHCFCYMSWFFDRGMLALWPGIKPTPSALEGKVPTAGSPGKSPGKGFWKRWCSSWGLRDQLFIKQKMSKC